jgi:glutathione S-transferase
MALKFYMTPGSCSTGIHILLETLELPFEARIVNIPAGEHLRPEYLKINPRGTIPTLVLNDARSPASSPSLCGSQRPTRAASSCRRTQRWLSAPSSFSTSR